MNSIPQEIFDRISDCLDSEGLKQVLTVSRAFQHSAERVFLREFSLTEHNVDEFLSLYTGDRFQYLHHVRFMPIFPKLICGTGGRTEWEEYCRDRPEDLLEKDTSYTRQINFLFETLKHLENSVGREKAAGKLRLTTYPPRRAIDWPCLHRTCVCWRVHLLHPETLPQLHAIQNFLLMDGDGVYGSYFDSLYGNHAEDYLPLQPPAKLDLRILLDIASKLPNLERLDCSFNSYIWGMTMDHYATHHFTQDWAGPHRDARHDFARSLDTTVLPCSLKQVYLNLHRRPHLEQGSDQREPLPNFVHPHSYDPFSTSLRLISYHLSRIVLRVIAYKTLFWPADGTTPHWPNLRIVDVRFISASPSGAWYFQGPQREGHSTSPGYEITKEHYPPLEKDTTDLKYDARSGVDASTSDNKFRVLPIEETLRSFLASFARAATCMPLLQKALLWTNLEFCPSGAFPNYEERIAELKEKFEEPEERRDIFWGNGYSSPGEQIEIHGMSLQDCAQRQLYWLVHDWQPDEALRSLFRDIGLQNHGSKVIEHWSSTKAKTWLSSRLHYDTDVEESPLVKDYQAKSEIVFNFPSQ